MSHESSGISLSAFLAERSSMNPELEAYVGHVADPWLIPGIYNYCNRRCERCQFTERCLTFRDLREYESRHPDGSVFEAVHDSFQKTFALLEAWC